jgi:hypothetical protein
MIDDNPNNKDIAIFYPNFRQGEEIFVVPVENFFLV